MSNTTHLPCFVQALTFATCIIISNLGLVLPGAAQAQMTSGTDVNISKLNTNYQNTCAIAVNPMNKQQLFVACNNETSGLFAASSIDRGLTWVNRTLAVIPGALQACCNPTVAWDIHGNLYLGYVADLMAGVVVLYSTNGGENFSVLHTFTGIVDQPTVVASNTKFSGVTEAVWVVWEEAGVMRASGAEVTGPGLGASGGPIAFNSIQDIPDTTDCSFGDVAIAPSGAVVQACQVSDGADLEGPAIIKVSTDADGLGPGSFGTAIIATSTNVGVKDFIPPQNDWGVDAAVGLAYDRSIASAPWPNSPRVGRLYLVYTDEVIVSGGIETGDTDIWLRYSDDDGATWSAQIRVDNEDNPTPMSKSQFLPRIASNPKSGNIAVCWHDNRNTAITSMEEYCTIATPTPTVPNFMPDKAVSDAPSSNAGAFISGLNTQFGDYSGMAYFQGFVHPVWADDSTTPRYEAYTDQVTGGAAANEGDPHMTTLDGIRYDFQSAGEFVSLRGDGLEIQTRQTPVATSSFPGPNAHTGLATCVSLNTAVAAQVGPHRVSYQPNIDGVPDPSGMQLRVDGKLVTLSDAGLDIGSGGRIANAAAGNGIEIVFPTGATLMATPRWWSSQSKWYLNVNVYNTLAIEGTLGATARDSWLPALPDGTSLGPRPSALPDRYVALNETFANAWRVTDATSLFDYKPGTTTADFTIPSWPLENPPCVVEQMPQVQPLDLAAAQTACDAITDENRKTNCVFDVHVTGETGFAENYKVTQQLEMGATTTHVSDDKDPTQHKESVTFTASVVRTASRLGATPTGTVQFIHNGNEVGDPVTLDSNGRAVWSTSTLAIGKHKVAAHYSLTSNTMFLASSSSAESHTVTGNDTENWILWLAMLIALLLIIIWWFRRP